MSIKGIQIRNADNAWEDMVIPVTSGGTSASNRHDAFTNLSYIGINPTGGAANDTAAKWRALGPGFAVITATGQLNGQPNQYGFVINYTINSELHQEFWTQSTGTHYYRGGNGSTTAMPNWTKIFDASHTIPITNGGTGGTTATAARNNLQIYYGTIGIWETYKVNEMVIACTSNLSIPYANNYVCQKGDISLPYTFKALNGLSVNLTSNGGNSSAYLTMNAKSFYDVANKKIVVSVHNSSGVFTSSTPAIVNLMIMGYV